MKQFFLEVGPETKYRRKVGCDVKKFEKHCFTWSSGQRPPEAFEERLKSRCPFVPTARNLPHNLSTMDIRAALGRNAWMAYTDSVTLYHEPVYKLLKWVSQIGVGKAEMLMNWRKLISVVHARVELCFFRNRECGAIEQTADHVISICPIDYIVHQTGYVFCCCWTTI